MGLLGAALITADGVPVPTWVRSLAAVVAVGALVVAASPALTSTFTGTNVLTNGPTTTLPAYVAAEGAYDASVGTLVLTPLADGSVSATVVWGGSETLGGQSTLTAARHALTDADIELAHVSVELTTGAATDVVRRAADQESVSFCFAEPRTRPLPERPRPWRDPRWTSVKDWIAWVTRDVACSGASAERSPPVKPTEPPRRWPRPWEARRSSSCWLPDAGTAHPCRAHPGAP